MRKYYLIFTILFASCTNNLEINQQEVTKTLTEFGKQNPENEIVIKSNLGEIELKLYNETPLHRANFIRLIKQGYFTDRTIYRIVKGLCIQGGGNDRDKLKYTIPAEFRPKIINKKGALAMARYSINNPEKMSSATEFFIITKGVYYEKEELQKYTDDIQEIYLKIGGEILFDNEYTVFGEVTKGFEIAEKIAKLEVAYGEKPINKPRFSIELK
jgi:cyclophilin family peptidyl-prolyl cis-trans isomerase